MANLLKMQQLEMNFMNPVYDGTNLTNRTLYSEVNRKGRDKEKIYYVPAYMRLKLKNIVGMELTNLAAQINAVIILSINITNLPPLVQAILKQNCELTFNRDRPEKLNGDNRNVVFKDKSPEMFDFTIRHQFAVGMKADVTKSPFELIQLILSVQLEQIILDADEVKGIMDKLEVQDKQKSQKQRFSLKIKFNLMDTLDERARYVKLSTSEEGTFGNYDVAQKLLRAEYTNNQLCSILKYQGEGKLSKFPEDQDIEQEIKQFDYGHFIIPLYKFPLVSLCTIFMPLIFLGILSLSVFFTGPGLADRVGSISALMMTFVALIQVIQDQLPPCRQITYSEWCVYLSTLINILCLAESLSIRNQDDSYVFVFYQNWMFILSCVTEIFLLLFIIVGLLIDKFKLRKEYNEEVKPLTKFEYKTWSNVKCDDHFRKKIDTKEIKILGRPKWEQAK